MTHKNTLSLKKSVFVRLILITCAAVLIFYVIGLTINNIGLKNVQAELQAALETHIQYVADQIDQDFDRLNFFMLEMMSDKKLLRFAFSYPILDDYERMAAIKTLSEQEYMIKRSTDLTESVQIMLPGHQRTIITDQAQYTDLDEEYFMCLNNQMHELLHICISETMKNPHFLDKLREVVEYHIKLNKNKDVREWGKETRKVTKKRK